MASEALILELLRQKQAQENQPSQFQQGLASLTQVMQAIAQGIQMYDTVKSLPVKYGRDITTTVPGTGTPAIPGLPPREAVPPLAQSEARLGRQIPAAGDPFFQSFLPQGVTTSENIVGKGGRTLSGSPFFPTPPTTPVSPGVAPVPATPAQKVKTHVPGLYETQQFAALADALKNFTGPGVSQALIQQGQRSGVDVGAGITNVAELKAQAAQQLQILKDQAKNNTATSINTEKSVANLNNRLKTVATERDKAQAVMQKSFLFQNEPGLNTEYNRASVIYSQKLGEYEAIADKLNQLQGISIKSETSPAIPSGSSFWDQFAE